MVDLTPASVDNPSLPKKMITSLKTTDDNRLLVVNQLLLP